MERRRKRRIFGLTAGCIGLLLFGVKWTGGEVHMLLGIFLTILLGTHMWKQRKRKGYVPGRQKRVNQIMAASAVLLLLSGILMHPLDGMILILAVHKFSALLLLAGCVVHVRQHQERRKEGGSCFIKS